MIDSKPLPAEPLTWGRIVKGTIAGIMGALFLLFYFSVALA